MNDQERNYNLPEFASSVPSSSNPGETMAGKVGVPAPDFEAWALDGARVRLSDFRGKRHVVFMTGAVTSPMCAFEVPAFNQLLQELADRDVSFFLLYTRESHPAENYPSHSSWEQKLSYARDLQRLEQVQLPIIVDGLDGKIHRSYGTWPNAIFVIHKDGRLIFRSNMANHRELRQFLQTCLQRTTRRPRDACCTCSIPSEWLRTRPTKRHTGEYTSVPAPRPSRTTGKSVPSIATDGPRTETHPRDPQGGRFITTQTDSEIFPRISDCSEFVSGTRITSRYPRR